MIGAGNAEKLNAVDDGPARVPDALRIQLHFTQPGIRFHFFADGMVKFHVLLYCGQYDSVRSCSSHNRQCAQYRQTLTEHFLSFIFRHNYLSGSYRGYRRPAAEFHFGNHNGCHYQAGGRQVC